MVKCEHFPEPKKGKKEKRMGRGVSYSISSQDRGSRGKSSLENGSTGKCSLERGYAEKPLNGSVNFPEKGGVR